MGKKTFMLAVEGAGVTATQVIPQIPDIIAYPLFWGCISMIVIQLLWWSMQAVIDYTKGKFVFDVKKTLNSYSQKSANGLTTQSVSAWVKSNTYKTHHGLNIRIVVSSNDKNFTIDRKEFSIPAKGQYVTELANFIDRSIYLKTDGGGFSDMEQQLSQEKNHVLEMTIRDSNKIYDKLEVKLLTQNNKLIIEKP